MGRARASGRRPDVVVGMGCAGRGCDSGRVRATGGAAQRGGAEAWAEQGKASAQEWVWAAEGAARRSDAAW